MPSRVARPAQLPRLLDVSAPLLAVAGSVLAGTVLGGLAEDESGAWWALILALPVLIAAIPVLWRNEARAYTGRAIAVGLMAFWCLLTGFSVGGAYLPALLVLTVALVAGRLSAGPRTPARS